MARVLTPEKLSEICDYILKGMNEKESCILSSFPYEDYLIAKEAHEAVRLLVEQTEVKFKFTHIAQIQKSNSDKNSMYLLEKLRPDEFGPKKSAQDGTVVNIISAIIKDIQNDNSQTIILPANRENRSQEGEDGQPKVLEVAAILK